MDSAALDRARADGWEPDGSIPVHDHAFYEDRGWWRHPDGRVLDEHQLREFYEATADERLETMRLYVASSQPQPPKALLDWMREVEQQLAALRAAALENAVTGNGHVRV